jgi:hypothetical protein
VIDAPVHILRWDDERQAWLAHRDGEPSFVWVQDFLDAYQAAHDSRGVDLIVPASIYQEWVATDLAPEQAPAGVLLVQHPTMVFDVDKLTDLLADRMAAIVPDGFHVEASDGMLWYSADDERFPGQLGNHHVGTAGTYVRVNYLARGQSAEDHLTGVAAQALDELQDYVDEATHDPWPGQQAPPRPYAEVRAGALHMWYGGPDPSGQVVLACEPIPLSELER